MPGFLTSKLAWPIAGAASIILALSLAFVWISKEVEIRSLTSERDNLQALYDAALADYTTCKANRITLEDANHQRNEAVKAAKAQSDGRVAELERTAKQAEREASNARKAANRILKAQGTGDVCQDADALILQEIGQ